MMALNSWSVPRSESEPVNCTAWTSATKKAPKAVVMKRMIFTRVTGTPVLRAALASPPAPKIQLPNCVRSRTQVATTVSPIHHKMAMSNEEPKRLNLVPNSVLAKSNPDT